MSREQFELRKKQTVKFMQENVIAINENDRQMWALITDVPHLGTPWQYVAFVLNIILPGKFFILRRGSRHRTHDGQLLQQDWVQDVFHAGIVLPPPDFCLPHRLVSFDLLGLANCEKEPRGAKRGG